jgi:hypothetical protein
MKLVSYSIKTKGLHNFARRLWTVFTQFGMFSNEAISHDVNNPESLRFPLEYLRCTANKGLYLL